MNFYPNRGIYPLTDPVPAVYLFCTVAVGGQIETHSVLWLFHTSRFFSSCLTQASEVICLQPATSGLSFYNALEFSGLTGSTRHVMRCRAKTQAKARAGKPVGRAIHAHREVDVKKVFAITQLALVAGVIIYGTLCLFRGDFTGAYATLPFLFFYYVWFVAKKMRARRNEADDTGPSDPPSDP